MPRRNASAFREVSGRGSILGLPKWPFCWQPLYMLFQLHWPPIWQPRPSDHVNQFMATKKATEGKLESVVFWDCVLESLVGHAHVCFFRPPKRPHYDPIGHESCKPGQIELPHPQLPGWLDYTCIHNNHYWSKWSVDTTLMLDILSWYAWLVSRSQTLIRRVWLCETNARYGCWLVLVSCLWLVRNTSSVYYWAKQQSHILVTV